MTDDGDARLPGPPTEATLDRVLRLLEPARRLINPKVCGTENLPDRGALLVGNHTLIGLLDAPLLCAELWERGIRVRVLGNHAHFKLPGWRDLLLSVGVIPGTPGTAEALMRRGETLLVFPGGGREVAKRRGEKYQLLWENRMGFARLAVRHGYPIVPFATVGAEDALDVVVDTDNRFLKPAQRLFEKISGSPDLLPIVRGVGPTPIPRPERQYYWFGEPIDTGDVDPTDDRTIGDIRDQTRTAIERGIDFLLEEQRTDPHRSVRERMFGPERRR
ncbi:acyltransferase family protein [Mycolicibacterium sp. S2-37]|uniref:lysophospholipid acyltransferase family protein n=1 Tax=Mycolicibacterium sp. S2-37 TaxID=2810297 RepID=UPI001A951C2F|nr:lysophospholipid acyltransferase family protein [Mycolicibacterium sp. S2-37]MBO0678728.1 acyltransferase family protein [Mycolicibacterium sp. S2-37]